MAKAALVETDLDFIRQVRQAGGDTVKKCYQCATCSIVCNLSSAQRPFPRKEMLMAGWGQKKRLMEDPDLWLCYQCNDCTTYCPRGARPGDVLAAIRTAVYRSFSFPSFMGKALASPKALPILIGLPMLVLLACIFMFAPTTPSGEFVFMNSEVIDFDLFLPHSSVDALFVIGNILIFIFAAVGFTRFWNQIHAPGAEKKLGFLPAAIKVAGEILSHNRFNECDKNKPRAVGHMLLLYGFLGAMITTGCIFVFVFIPHYLHLLGVENLSGWFTVPIDIPHPVKFLGAFSGLALMTGGLLLIMRRFRNRDEVGANGYADYLFLYVISSVGLTGMLSWITRLSGPAMLAYVVYFVHLLAVWVLLWYMPYSKFAHMFYRTMGLIYARQIGREPR
ncbi:MAG: quinone-interacting membrane-bound oxidoreductase complex subunit QmoC [bacterium]